MADEANSPRPVVLCGVSGSWKDSLLDLLLARFPQRFGKAVSHATRAPRPNEVPGTAYHFISHEASGDKGSRRGSRHTALRIPLLARHLSSIDHHKQHNYKYNTFDLICHRALVHGDSAAAWLCWHKDRGGKEFLHDRLVQWRTVVALGAAHIDLSLIVGHCAWANHAPLLRMLHCIGYDFHHRSPVDAFEADGTVRRITRNLIEDVTGSTPLGHTQRSSPPTAFLRRERELSNASRLLPAVHCHEFHPSKDCVRKCLQVGEHDSASALAEAAVM